MRQRLSIEAFTLRSTLQDLVMLLELLLLSEVGSPDLRTANPGRMVLQGDAESLASLQIKVTSKVASVDLHSLPKHSEVHVDR